MSLRDSPVYPNEGWPSRLCKTADVGPDESAELKELKPDDSRPGCDHPTAKAQVSRQTTARGKTPGRWRLRCAKLFAVSAVFLCAYPPWTILARSEGAQSRIRHAWVWTQPSDLRLMLLEPPDEKPFRVSIDLSRFTLEFAGLVFAMLLIHPRCPLWPARALPKLAQPVCPPAAGEGERK